MTTSLAAVAAPVLGVDPSGRRAAVLAATSSSGLGNRFDGPDLDWGRHLVVSRAAVLTGALGAPPRPEDPP